MSLLESDLGSGNGRFLAKVPTKMITEEHTKESLCLAYVEAVAAKAGVNLASRRHDYGIDGTFHPVRIIKGRRIESGFPLDYQLKSTINFQFVEDVVKYDLEAKTFNDLVQRHQAMGAIPMVLILLCLPPNPSEWLSLDEQKLELRHCCYWKMLQGTETTNTSTVRIEIPRQQRFDPSSLTSLLHQCEEGTQI